MEQSRHSPRHRQQGFTLIELLVVLVLIGVLAGLAVLSSGNSLQRRTQQEAERLARVMALLADEAILRHTEYGLSLDRQGYQPVRFDAQNRRWEALPDLHRHALEEPLRLHLKLEGRALRLADSLTGRKAGRGLRKTLTPELLILSSGELSPFTLQIRPERDARLAWTLSSDGLQLPVPIGPRS